MSQQSTKKDLFHESLSKQIAEQIKSGTVSWLKPQDNEHIDLPYNPITGKNYKATANMVLSAKGYKDNRWLTYDQAAEQGYHVKKGEKATEIAFYHYVDYKTKEKLERPKIQTVKLFNAEQLTGIEAMPIKTNSKEEALAKVQSIFENSQVKIVNNQKDRIFYRQKDDTIYMPPKEAFKDELAYSSGAIHELCRWAGTGEERLNFPAAPFGTEAFAREKLRTEIATYMLTKELGIPFEPQGQQFAEQWVKIIEAYPFEILNAAKDAEKIKGFVMEFDKTLEIKQEQELEQNPTTFEKAFSDFAQNAKERFGIEYTFSDGEFKGTLVDDKKLKQEILNQINMTASPAAQNYFLENTMVDVRKDFDFAYMPHFFDLEYEKYNELSIIDREYVENIQGQTIETLKSIFFEFGNEAGTLLNLAEKEQLRQEREQQAIVEAVEKEKQTEREQLPKKEWKQMIKLSVSREEKDDAKALGAKWSAKQQTWYVLDGTDLQPFYKWLPKDKKAELIIASRDYLNVPREEKDEAKALGAKWDKWQKAWYVEKGTDLEPFAKWGKLDLNERQQKQENAAEQSQSAEQEQKAEQNIAETKTYIAVSWDDKDEAKKLGAKWDGQNKSWYVEKGQDLMPFKEWLIDENTVIPAKQETVAPEIEFAQHLRDCGLDVDNPIMDGQIHRVPVIGMPGGKDGAYCGYVDGVPNGWAQNYVTGEKSKFVSSGTQLTDEERAKQRAEFAQRQQEREEKRQQGYDLAANNAKRILNNSVEADNNHPYLQAKGIEPHIAKQNNYAQLVIPLRNIYGDIRGVQFINEDGSKQFLSGIEKKGNFALLSEDAKDNSTILICEGFATGASLHEATKLPVAVAFDAGNLEPVAKAIHEKFQNQIIICADNDQHKENNVGLEYAQKATQAVNGKLAVPMFTAEEKAQKLTDFNDLHKSQGLEAVKRQVSQAKSLIQNKQQSKVNGLSR